MALISCEKVEPIEIPETQKEEEKQPEDNNQNTNGNTDQTSTMTINITTGGKTITATLADNSSGKAFADKLKEGPVSIEMHDYGGFEKVGPLGFSIVQNNEQINTVPGDIILYQGNNICLYYDTNSWNFTRLGKMNDVTQDQIKSFLSAGGGNINVTFSLKQ